MAIPDGAHRALSRQLEDRRQQRWSDLHDLQIRYRGSFAYITGVISDYHSAMPLFRLRFLGSPHQWGFAIYLASNDRYEDSFLPTGSFTGTPAEALDCACGLYLNDITAWTETNSRENF